MSATPAPRRRVLVTGGAGFIGSHLVDRLRERGDEVVVLDDLSTGRLANLDAHRATPGFELVEGTVTERAQLDPLLDRCDFVFHLAAAVGVELILRDPLRVLETNVLGTHALLESAARHGRPVLLASTSEIYGKSEEVPFHEESDRLLGPTTNWRWIYSSSKAIDEAMALAFHRQRALPVIVARLFNTVGPRQTGAYGMVVPRLVEQALAGRPLTIYGDGLQSRTFCDVRDTVEALLALADGPGTVGEVFNVGGDREITLLELARLVQRVVLGSDAAGSSRSELTLVPYDRAYEPGFEDLRRRAPDTAKLRRVTGWRARIALETTLADVAAERRIAGHAPAGA